MENILTQKKYLGDVLESVYQYFEAADLYYGHGTDNPWDEACALVLGHLNLDPGAGEEVLEQPLNSKIQDEIYAIAGLRVATRKPLSYLMHQAWFAGLKFYVDERVIIPRSPFAELIQKNFRPWLNQKPKRVLDLCTGSACIALAVLHYGAEDLQVDAIELSSQALEVATINKNRLDPLNRLRLIQSDLFSALEPQKQYDLIISNPPYVDAEDMDNLPPEYRHEPKMSLEAGNDGLEIVAKILKEAKQFLKPGGLLFVELGNSRSALEARYPDLPFVWLEFEAGGEGVFL
ncbi:MAG: 50S ribosomal protein L3 N(5)-glutamine methyltransferase, partial [Gammaproteobacteria bacterium]